MLETQICRIKLKNPTVLASGILGNTGQLLVRVAESGAGAVTSKSITLNPRKGHEGPTAFKHANELLINAMGLPNPGIDKMIEEIKFAKSNTSVPVFASIFAPNADEFSIMAQRLCDEAKPDLIELNLSCPNARSEFGEQIAFNPMAAAEIVSRVKENCNVPCSAKLSPNTHLLSQVAKAVEEAGADAITAINTMPAMAINIDAKKPILTNKAGGMSGPALKPIALKAVYEITEVVNIPVIGTGGITDYKDALEMIMAGATATGIGTAIYYGDLSVFKDIPAGMEKWLEENGYSSLDQIRGCAHA